MATALRYRSEDSLWQMVKAGQKTWEARQWDLSDDRCYSLATSLGQEQEGGIVLTLVNKATGEELEATVTDVHFPLWAPGWYFMLLQAVTV